MNPKRKIYKHNSIIEKEEGISFIITKGRLSGKVLARGDNVKIVDGQIMFPSNLRLKKHLGEKVTVALAWGVEDAYNFLVYEDKVNAPS